MTDHYGVSELKESCDLKARDCNFLFVAIFEAASASEAVPIVFCLSDGDGYSHFLFSYKDMNF